MGPWGHTKIPYYYYYYYYYYTTTTTTTTTTLLLLLQLLLPQLLLPGFHIGFFAWEGGGNFSAIKVTLIFDYYEAFFSLINDENLTQYYT